MYRANNSHPFAKVKNVWSYIFIPPYAFMVQCKLFNNAGIYIQNTIHDTYKSFNLN
jgi:hypothetical protein